MLLPRGFLLARLRSEKWWYYGTVKNAEGHLSQSKISSEKLGLEGLPPVGGVNPRGLISGGAPTEFRGCTASQRRWRHAWRVSGARTVQYRGEASMPNGTKSRERHRSFSRYGTSTRSACTGTDRIYVASTSRQVEFTSHLQVLNVAFTPKIYVAHATRCELSSKVTVDLLLVARSSRSTPVLVAVPGVSTSPPRAGLASKINNLFRE